MKTMEWRHPNRLTLDNETKKASNLLMDKIEEEKEDVIIDGDTTRDWFLDRRQAVI